MSTNNGDVSTTTTTSTTTIIITKSLLHAIFPDHLHNHQQHHHHPHILHEHRQQNDSIFLESNHNDSITSSTTTVLFIPEGAAMMGFVCAILISLVGVVGNSLTIIALMKQAGRLNSRATTTFVIHLAIADLLFCLLVLPQTAARYLTRSWPFGPTLCRLFPLLYYGTVATSLMLITMITINRYVPRECCCFSSLVTMAMLFSYVLIAYYRQYNQIYTRFNSILLIIFCWLFSYGIVSIPLFELWGRFGYHSNTFSCTILRDSAGRSPKKFLFVLGFFLPMTTIIICYGLIYIHIKRQTRMKKHLHPQPVNSNVGQQQKMALRKNSSKDSSNHCNPFANQNKTPRRDIRLTLLTSVVFGAFLICFLPLFIGNVFIPDHRYPYFHVFSSAFAWLNSCINPFIYFAMNARYRQAFKRLFQNKKSCVINSGTELSLVSDTNKSPSQSIVKKDSNNRQPPQ